MRSLETSFWLCVALVAYAYLLYPVLLLCLARIRGREVKRGRWTGTVSLVMAAHNEEERIAERREELCDMLSALPVEGELIIVSNGSTDQTAARARKGASRSVHVIEIEEKVGKAAALTRGCQAATGDVVVFADVRQRWAADALARMLENFADPGVGGVSGELMLTASSGAVAGVGLYWRYEKSIRKLESQLHSTMGVTGAISAVRRTLFRPIPPQTILDDVYWPLQVVMQGFRVVHDERARAFDRLPDRVRDEFQRKVRTLSGNFQLLFRLPEALLPWRNPIWFQLISHKVLRLLVPWLMLQMLACSLVLTGHGFRELLWAQVMCYLIAALGTRGWIASRARIAGIAGSFLVVNAAAWVAFWMWISGRSTRTWRRVAYDAAPVSPGISQPIA